MIFELSAAVVRNERYAHPAATIESADFMGYAFWKEAIQNASSFEEASAAPKKFSVMWDIGHRPRSMELADWPASVYLWPVCSSKMWAVLRSFCPSTGWIQLPPDKHGQPCGWGVLFGYSIIPVGECPSASERFFAVGPGRGSDRTFVSDSLRSALEAVDLVGLCFNPADF